MLGLSAHGGKYSCAYCLGVAGIYSGVHRTFGHLQDHYNRYKQAGTIQKYYNTINECLISGERDERVLDKVMLPELHMMMGNVNHIPGPILELWPGFMD